MNVYGVALSGLNAASARIGVSANNVANSTTEDFQAKQATARPLDGGGVVVDVKTKNPATVPAPALGGEGTVQLPNVSLEQEVVNQVSASYDFKANLKVLEVQKELDKALLDIQA